MMMRSIQECHVETKTAGNPTHLTLQLLVYCFSRDSATRDVMDSIMGRVLLSSQRTLGGKPVSILTEHDCELRDQ